MLSASFWEKLQKDLEAQDSNHLLKPSSLEPAQQHKLLTLVLEHGLDWKKISGEMELKTEKEAFVEFMRIKTPEVCQPNLYLHKENKTSTIQVPAQREYSSLDEYFLQCKMLKVFSHSEVQWLEPRKRESKAKIKQAQQIMLLEF